MITLDAAGFVFFPVESADDDEVVVTSASPLLVLRFFCGGSNELKSRLTPLFLFAVPRVRDNAGLFAEDREEPEARFQPALEASFFSSLPHVAFQARKMLIVIVF